MLLDIVHTDIAATIVFWWIRWSIQPLLEWMETNIYFERLHREEKFCRSSVLSITLFVFVSKNWHINAFKDWCIICRVSKGFSALVRSRLPNQETKSNNRLLWSKWVLRAISMHLGYIKLINDLPDLYFTHKFKLFVRKEKRGMFKNDQLFTVLSQHLPFFIAVENDCLNLVLYAKKCSNSTVDEQTHKLQAHFDKSASIILTESGVITGFESITLKSDYV